MNSRRMPRTRSPKVPKMRAWGKAGRKIMTMVIPSKKEKLGRRQAIKQALKKEIENLDLISDSE